MAQSAEYPDLKWVQAKSWSAGRPSGPPLWVVVHTTEGSEGLQSAEDGAAYDTRRTDGTSTHYFHDQDNTIQCVKTSDRANAAKGTGNHFGIHHELCGKTAQNPTQWDDEASTGTINNAAKQAARDAHKWGIPIRRLTTAQVAAHAKGFCEHNNISQAFHESDHDDPGKNYPWDEFLELTNFYYNHPGADMEVTLSAATQASVAQATINKFYSDIAAKDKTPLAKALQARSGDGVDTKSILEAIAGNHIDPTAFAAQIAAPLAAALSPLLPDGIDVTPEKLVEAFRIAFASK